MDRFGGVMGGIPVGDDDRGDRIADNTHRAVDQCRARHFGHRLAVTVVEAYPTRDRIYAIAREVGAGQDRNDARHGKCGPMCR